MKNGTWMRIESNNSGNRVHCSRSLDDGTHDQLMTKVQSVKTTKRQHPRTVNASVVGAVKKTHKFIADCQLSIADCVFGSRALFSFLMRPRAALKIDNSQIVINRQSVIGNRQLAIGN